MIDALTKIANETEIRKIVVSEIIPEVNLAKGRIVTDRETRLEKTIAALDVLVKHVSEMIEINTKINIETTMIEVSIS